MTGTMSAWSGRSRGSRIHYAWVVLAVTFLVMLMAAGFRATPGVFLKPYEDEFGWSPGLVGGGISISLLLYGAGAPFAGRDRRAARHAARVQHRARARGDRLGADAGDGQPVAVLRAVGRAGRHRHRRDRDPAGRHRREPLVRAAPRARGGSAGRLVRRRAADLPAAARLAGRGLRLAHRFGVRQRHGVRDRRTARDHLPARPAGAARPAPVRRHRRHAAARAVSAQPVPARHRRGQDGLAQARLLAAGGRVLHLRRDHQRPDRHAPDRRLLRPRPVAGVRRRACSPRSASSTSSAPPPRAG